MMTLCADAPGTYYSAPSVPDVRFDDEESAFGAALAALRRQGSDLPPGCGTGSPGPFVDPGASWHVLAALPTGSRGSGGHRRFPRMTRSTGRQACSAAGQGRAMARHLIGGDGALAASFPWRNRFVWPRRRAPSRPATEPALDQGLVPSPARPPTLHTCFVASPVSNETAGHRRPRARLADPTRPGRPGPARLRLAPAAARGLTSVPLSLSPGGADDKAPPGFFAGAAGMLGHDWRRRAGAPPGIPEKP